MKIQPKIIISVTERSSKKKKKKKYQDKDDTSVLQDGTAGTDSGGTDHRVGRYGKDTGKAIWGVKG
jgi:hypothetical protein